MNKKLIAFGQCKNQGISFIGLFDFIWETDSGLTSSAYYKNKNGEFRASNIGIDYNSSYLKAVDHFGLIKFIYKE